MKLILTFFVVTFIKYSSCDEAGLSPEEQHNYKCKVLIEKVYQESCTILMRPRAMGHVMLAFQKGNDSKGIDFCRLVPEGADCVLNNLPLQVIDDCKSLEEYQSKIVRAQHDKTYSEYYCANDMQHLRDRSEHDGMDCLYVNEFYNCKNNIQKTQPVKLTRKEELCRDNYLDITCSEHFGPCQNLKVRDIQIGLFEVMRQGLECPPN